jgi:hypothetical protein
MKVKPANHLFRVGTDDDRSQYRHQRAEELRPFLEPRRQLAAALAAEATVAIPRDDGYAVCAQGTVAGTDTLVGLARETVERVDLAAKKADANKPFMVKLLDMKRLTVDSPLLQFGLRRDIVAPPPRAISAPFRSCNTPTSCIPATPRENSARASCFTATATKRSR